MQESLIVSPGYPTPILARTTDPDKPGQNDGGWDSEYAAAAYAFHSFGMWENWQDRVFDPTKALTYSVLWGCVSYIAQTIASLGWHQYEKQERGQKKIPLDDPVSWLLGVQANPEMNSFDFRQVMLKDALLWGNGYAEIERTGGGRPYWFWRLDPGRVQPERDDDGDLYYRVRNNPGSGGDTILDPANVFHLKGLSADGLMGYSVIHMARHSIELGLQEERFGSSFFKRGLMPGGMLEIPGVMKKPERDELRTSFQKTYGGSENAGRVVVLTGGAKFSPVTMPNSDAQWLESRTFQADEIARWFRVPPHKVGLLARATFSNIEQQSIEAVQDCLLPWCRRLESEADIKLFGRNTMGRRYTRLNLDSLLRGDTMTQTATVTQRVNNGLLTVNEGREYFDMNPLPGDVGDTPLVQGAMTPLERVVEEPEPAPAPAPAPFPGKKPAPEPGQGEEGVIPEGFKKTFESLLAEVYGRLIRFEVDRVKKAGNNGRLRQWMPETHESHCAGMLLPVVEAFLLASGRQGDAGRLAAWLASDHVGTSFADPPLDPAGPRAQRQAEYHLALLWDCGGPGSGVPGPCPQEHSDEPHPDDEKNIPNPRLPESSRPTLTKEQSEAVKQYTNNYYRDLNNSLKDAKTLTIAQEQMHTRLNEAMDKTKEFKEPVQVNRSLELSGAAKEQFLAQCQAAQDSGKPVQFKGWCSTTTRPIGYFGGNVHLEISATRGLDVKPHSKMPQEYELLLRAGSQFRITSIEQRGDDTHIKAEQVRDKGGRSRWWWPFNRQQRGVKAMTANPDKFVDEDASFYDFNPPDEEK